MGVVTQMTGTPTGLPEGPGSDIGIDEARGKSQADIKAAELTYHIWRMQWYMLGFNVTLQLLMAATQAGIRKHGRSDGKDFLANLLPVIAKLMAVAYCAYGLTHAGYFIALRVIEKVDSNIGNMKLISNLLDALPEIVTPIAFIRGDKEIAVVFEAYGHIMEGIVVFLRAFMVDFEN